jgi:hypothetical protein
METKLWNLIVQALVAVHKGRSVKYWIFDPPSPYNSISGAPTPFWTSNPWIFSNVFFKISIQKNPDNSLK